MYEHIIDALRRGAAADALSAARDAVAAQPQDATAQRLLSAALQMGGDREGALEAIDQALTLAPEDANLHMARASLLLGDRNQLDEAQAALARAIGLDPNQFPAYIMQAQLALGRGDVEEAHRLARAASRLAPNHPQVAGIEGMVALQRGQASAALNILTAAAQRAPGDLSLRPALGFAYMANGHHAFAEKVFRSLLEQNPESMPLRTLIADLVYRQGRAAEAADSLASLARGQNVPPGLRRAYARIELAAGRPERALEVLQPAFERDPDDILALEGLVEVWRHTNDVEGARATLEAALNVRPQSTALWRARLLFESFAGEGARSVAERWIEAMPEHIPALEARITIHDQAGETDEADAIAYQIAALQPGRSSAELRVVDSLLRRDPKAAVSHVEGLIDRAQNTVIKRGLRQLLGRCLDAAGEPDQAVTVWSQLQAELAPQALPLPPLTQSGDYPLQGEVAAGAPGVLFLWGPPGSMVERLGATLMAAGAPVLIDRTSPTPPRDPFQRYGTAQELHEGKLDGSFVVTQWRAALAGRGAVTGPVFDWLLWWDNAFLHGLRPHVPEATLIVGLRDPRDMLLDWLAWGAGTTPFALQSPVAGAQWLAQVLAQIAQLHEQDLIRHALIRLDEVEHNPQALAFAINQTLSLELPPPPPNALGTRRFAAGRWRAYAQPLAEAFALLQPVAVRLGYPES